MVLPELIHSHLEVDEPALSQVIEFLAVARAVGDSHS